MADFGFDPQLSAREMRKIKYYERMFAKLDSREIKRQNSDEKSKAPNHSKSWSDHSPTKSSSNSRASTINNTSDSTTDFSIDTTIIKTEPTRLNQNIHSDCQDGDWNYSYKRDITGIGNASGATLASTITTFTSDIVGENKWVKGIAKKKSRSQKREKSLREESTDAISKRPDSTEMCDYNYAVGDYKCENPCENYQKIEQYEIPEKLQKITQSSYVNNKLTTTTHDDTAFSFTPLTTSIPFIDDIQNINGLHSNTEGDGLKDQTNSFQEYTVRKCESMLNICPKLVISLPKIEAEQSSFKDVCNDAVFENNLDPTAIFSHSYSFSLLCDPRKLSFTSHLLARLKNITSPPTGNDL
ncbi:hypothetical protein BmR1_04g06835 [Babesia microti strain RI]|uniref:Uncharacterized protein n=1 Tax=Babesia microti (strain RI) TaxID=1133968 RepID=I7J8R6_BABMR|nr:hypothetical protein BmR1_04g06835 [Babesia microti strain RI]CCF75563.1 hypothetical protein BmR1_04g06835 [Babesia microti strain RI]|eukprot:XP_012649971.1 hypothetical protein BmR1_04g06835 [Babesia microti strain RI]